MPSFFCEICNYTTNRKNNFSQHLSTKKHIRNIENNVKNNETEKHPQNLLTPKKSILTFFLT